MSDSGSAKGDSSDEDNKNTGQYDDEDEDNAAAPEDDRSSEDEKPAPKSIPKKAQRGKRNRFIDDAAEESDDQGGTRENDDDDEDEDEDEEDEEDVRRPGRKRSRNKFIVDDDVEEEDAGVKKEKIIISEREKRLDAADYELIAENTGLNIEAPDDYEDEDDDEDDDDDADKPARRRVRQSSKVMRDDDDEVKTTKKKFNQFLGGAEAASHPEAPSRHQRESFDDDSDNSMDSFIEKDMEDDDADRSVSKRKRRSESVHVSAHKHELAIKMFDDDKFSDEENEDKREEAGLTEGDRYNTFEPQVQIEKFITPEDIRIREIDEPERLQIDLKNRFPVKSVEDLRSEAEWMLSNHRWQSSDLIDDMGDVQVDFVHPETKESTMMTKTERSQLLQNRLIEKIVNVLCYIRGVENEAILHGPITIEDVDSGGPKQLEDSDDVKEAEWEYVGPENSEHHGYKRRITAKLDIPFILRYRQEYWRDELRPTDVWKIYDLDGKWSAFRTRQEALVAKFNAVHDDEGAAKGAGASNEESLNDVAALFDLRHVKPEQARQEGGEGRRKMPVKVTKYQQCEQAGLGEIVPLFAMSPVRLAENLDLPDARPHRPPTPAQDPVSLAMEAVPGAEKWGFRDADAVLKGVRFMAAKQLATEPAIRDYLRIQFAQGAQVSVKITKKGKESAEAFHRVLLHMHMKCHHDLEDERIVELVKARDEGLLETHVRLTREAHEGLVERLKRLYLADDEAGDGGDGGDEGWNGVRAAVMEEALEGHVYPYLQEELLNIRCRYAKDVLLFRCQESLEALLRVAPYSWSRDQDSKPERAHAIMAVAYAEPTECVVIDAYGEVVEYLSIHLRVSFNKRQPMQPGDVAKLEQFVKRTQPDVMVLGAKDVRCRTVKEQLDYLVNHCQTRKHLHRQIDVLYADECVAQRYAHSERAAQEFPKFPPTRLAAVSLARRLQDPLREMAGMCVGQSEDVLSLQLHPLQHALDRGERLRFLHRAFVTVVNEVGVDINLAVDRQPIHGNTLQFVSGLGPRKAGELLQVLKQTGCVQYRIQLLQDATVRATGMRNVVWTNAVGFLRITTNSSQWNTKLDVGQDVDEDDNVVLAGGGPAEGTRIHPESYTLAKKIAVDALEDAADEGGEQDEALRDLARLQEVMRPEKLGLLDELDLEAYAELIRGDMGLKQLTLGDIVAELKAPFADPRRLDRADSLPMKLRAWELTPREQFNLLTMTHDRLVQPGDEEVVRAMAQGMAVAPAGLVSTLVGTVVYVKVVHLHRHKPRDRDPVPPPDQPELPYKIVCRLENGVTGILDKEQFGDDEDDRRAFAGRVQVDAVLQCVIISVAHAEFEVQLSHSPRLLRASDAHAAGDAEARAQRNKQRVVLQSRAITHPSFRNLPRDKVLALLAGEEIGEYLIRPSASGMDKLTITRKVFDDVYADTAIQMHDQTSPVGLGRVLVVERMRFEDLDELIVGYVDPVVANEKKLMKHDKFHSGPADAIRAKLVAEKAASGAPKSCPYLLGFSPAIPGTFAIFYLPGSKQVMEDGFRAVPEGYRCGGINFRGVGDMLNWWKKSTAARVRGDARPVPPHAVGAPPPGGPQPDRRAPAGYAGSGSWGGGAVRR